MTRHIPPHTSVQMIHGRSNTYGRYGCRCDSCRAAKRRMAKTAHLHPRALVPVYGSRLRLRALMALGWTSGELAQRLWPEGTPRMGPLLYGPTTRVTRDTAERVRAIYETLWATPGPSALTRSRAARAGYVLPMWLDDDRLDDPTYVPTLPTAAEIERDRVAARREARLTRDAEIRRLTALGYDGGQIAVAFGGEPTDRTARQRITRARTPHVQREAS